MCKYGENKTTRIMVATVPHITSGSGLRKFQADGFLLDRVYKNTAINGITTRGTKVIYEFSSSGFDKSPTNFGSAFF